tara:strand:+ start:1515 stop:1736 length:222 start_codon:yes stop_codon:yes gene_type:complete
VRAKTVPHVEYEILKHIIEKLDILEVKERMVNDEHSEIRFDKGAASVARLIQNLADRRTHRLPKEHVDYEVKE